MIWRFNQAQLSKKQRVSLNNFFEQIGLVDTKPDDSKTPSRVEIRAIEFPDILELRNGVDLYELTWSEPNSVYNYLQLPVEKSSEVNAEPEPEPEPERKEQVEQYDPVKSCIDLFGALNREQQSEFLKQIWSSKSEG